MMTEYLKVKESGIEFPFNLESFIKNLGVTPSELTEEFLESHNIFKVLPGIFPEEVPEGKIVCFTQNLVNVNGVWQREVKLLDKPATFLSVDNLELVLSSVIQNRLDAFAQTKGYTNILSACTYASSKIPKFAAEGQHCVEVRDSCWAQLDELLKDFKTGVRPLPNSIQEVLKEFPELTWNT